MSYPKIDRCYYCERMFGVAPYGDNKALFKTRDHIIPVSHGGISKAANYVYACHRCNLLKADRTPDQFAIHLGELLDMPKHKICKKTLTLILLNTENLIFTIAPYRDQLIMKSKKEPDWEPMKIQFPYRPTVINVEEFAAYKGIKKPEIDWIKEWKKKYDKMPTPNFHEK